MANYNLAQDEPYLKHLDKALKQISKLHHEIHDVLLALEENMLKAYGLVNVSWPKVTELFTTLECLKGNRREFDRSQNYIKEVRDEKQIDLKPTEQEVVDQTS